jgi:L-asparaginase II
LTRIRDAMMAHPELVAGEHNRLDTAVMRAYPMRVVSKGGAEGVLAIGLPPGALPEPGRFGDAPMGIAAKIEDGNLAQRAGHVTAVSVLGQVGLATDPLPRALADYASPPILDPRGEPSGEIRSVLRLG